MANALGLDPEEAVRLAVFNNDWEVAIETASLSKRVDLIETEIAPAVKSAGEQANDDLNQMDR